MFDADRYLEQAETLLVLAGLRNASDTTLRRSLAWALEDICNQGCDSCNGPDHFEDLMIVINKINERRIAYERRTENAGKKNTMSKGVAKSK